MEASQKTIEIEATDVTSNSPFLNDRSKLLTMHPARKTLSGLNTRLPNW